MVDAIFRTDGTCAWLDPQIDQVIKACVAVGTGSRSPIAVRRLERPLPAAVLEWSIPDA